MNAGSFALLSKHRKLQWLHFRGEHVTSIRYYGYKVLLYLIEGFYVEVFFNHRQDLIERIEVLDYSSTRMKFYGDQIKLPL